jgi:hypothetical protein
MCPADEIKERKKYNGTHAFEKFELVKRYSRDVVQDRPELIRPTPICYLTVSFLRDCVMDTDRTADTVFKGKYEFGDVYGFVSDRFRSIV